jgi:CHAT domain-containing protein/tetratricopeptide (TPR) repeat protein
MADYATIQHNLGLAYAQMPTGDRAANLARAIECFTEALRFRTAEADPLNYAALQLNLGNAYDLMPTGDRAANLVRAIECYNEALRFFTAEADPLNYAMTQTNLGNAYGRLPTADRVADLNRAIDCYTEALRFCTAEADPPGYARTQTNLGSVFFQLPTGDRAADLARAIDCYTEALRFRTAEARPAEYADTQNGLGNAFTELPTGDRTANLQRAIDCYTEALRFRTAEADPLNYAETQNNLGNAYRRLPTGNRAANLARAIGCYTEALRFYIPEAAPLNYAMTQTNLGNAYHELSKGDQAANLARAIECYTEALRFYTAEAAPLNYAMTQNNLGNAHFEFPTGALTANLERAIGCYTEALRFYTAEADPLNYAMTQNNLGNAYLLLPSGDSATNLARAIGCYTEALRFRTAEADPLNYAMTQNNLGSAYLLPSRNRAPNPARAIECYTEALRFYTAAAAPLDYAKAQNGLGYAYWKLPTEDRAANLGQAIDFFTEALRFQPAEAVPSECRRTAGNLGDLHFEQGRWAEAHTAYTKAIRARELLYQATGSEAGRQAELGVAGDAVGADAYCLARLGRLAEAVQRLEAGRARALGEALARDRAALQEASEADRAAFRAAVEQIKALEAEERTTDAPTTLEGRSFAERSAGLVQARADLATVIRRIRAYLPGFMGEGLDYPAIAAVASPTRPLAYLLTTSRGGLALLVLPGLQAPAPQHAIWLDNFTADRLDELLVKRNESGEVRGGYLPGQVTGNLDQLAVAVADNIEILRREVLRPLAERLADLGAARATLIPVGRLSLLPLPAAAPEGCTLALAPSARALQAANDALAERAEPTSVLLAVANPLPPPARSSPLDYAELEVRAIERFFAARSRQILPKERATKKAVTQALLGATHLHLACHGAFNPNEPLDSALYLAGGGRLTLRDLLDGNLDLSSQQLTVLSACQTGITEFSRVPDEVIGLPAGFMLAGIPSVVATLWPVNDRSTAVLMAEFYRLLIAEQQDFATALGRAGMFLRDATARDLAEWFERRYADSGGTDRAAYEAAETFRSRYDPADRPYAHPFYWAGFVYSGP